MVRGGSLRSARSLTILRRAMYSLVIHIFNIHNYMEISEFTLSELQNLRHLAEHQVWVLNDYEPYTKCTEELRIIITKLNNAINEEI